jgi:hypothetical protein
MGRSSEAWSNLTLPARFVKPEPAGGYARIAVHGFTAGHDFQHTIRVVAACRLHPTVPIAMPDILRGRLGLR